MAREHDIVLFGATGFTGELTAEYLGQHAPAGARIALAGRSLEKLTQTRDRLARKVPALADAALVVADSRDLPSLEALATSTRVVITTVGPYLHYGEGLVAACAAAGTGYVDLCGEPEFVDTMYIRYHQQARETGAKLIHACGFDSLPYDLGVLWTIAQLGDAAASSPVAVQGFALASGSISGGTYHSAVNAMSRLKESSRISRQRRTMERHAEDGKITEGRSVSSGKVRVHKEPIAGGWVVPAPTIDPQIVMRSARLLDSYGPSFSYAHYIVTRKLSNTVMLGVGIGFLMMMAQLDRTRKLVLKLKKQGSGPSEEKRAKSFFRVRFITDTSPAAGRDVVTGRRLVTEVTGGDPGYGETAKMLAESALCLAFDDLPDVGAGQLTSAVALGFPLIERLKAAGIGFNVVSESGGRLNTGTS